jgi:gliding motility-associated-like protein
MKRLFLTSVLLALTLSIYSQTVSIGLFSNDPNFNTTSLSQIQTKYEQQFGAGNVSVSDYGTAYTTTLATLNQHDVIIVNVFVESNLPQSLANDLITLYNNGKHLIISTEGSLINDNEKFASYVWNNITGESITETDAHASGTTSPPRFHPSNGPGGLSSNQNIGGSSTTYASFGNLSPLNTLHQRAENKSECSNIEGVDALYPHSPSLNTGTLYINGETFYPFANPNANIATDDLGNNLVILHKALVTNNQNKLNELNSWANDDKKQQSYDFNKEDIVFVIPNIFSPNNDGNNDVFKAAEITHDPIALNFKVLNRWGNEVYTTTDVNINWNGKNLNSAELSEGVYYYFLEATFKSDCELNNAQHTLNFKGSVEIVR